MQHPLLSGFYDHTLDPKGRVTLPSRYREYFDHGAELVRFPDKEPCISVFHPDAWNDYDAKHIDPRDASENEEDQWFVRLTYANKYYVEPDRQGRLLLPPQLAKDLKLSGKVKILGVRDRLEIWDPEEYEKRKAERRRKDG
jgi:MraZ protein